MIIEYSPDEADDCTVNRRPSAIQEEVEASTDDAAEIHSTSPDDVKRRGSGTRLSKLKNKVQFCLQLIVSSIH